MREIDFTTLGCLGYLWLPPITVDDSTRPVFLNLIAYEMCLDFQNDFAITSYVSFLDSLIDEPSDVKLLRNAGILYNYLGSDDEVAQVFNEIGTWCLTLKYTVKSNHKFRTSTRSRVGPGYLKSFTNISVVPGRSRPSLAHY